MLIDLHVHSSMTQGASLTLEELVAGAKNTGLDGFCLTDVHTVGSVNAARELAASESIVILVGFESFTDQGHYLVFVPEPEGLPDLDDLLPRDSQGKVAFELLLETVKNHNGILVVAHPFDRNVPESPGDSLLRLKGISAVEVLNASRSSLANELAEEIAAGAGLPGVGSSDARESANHMGRFATLVKGPLSSEADLIDRIKSFDVWPVAIGEPAFPSHKPVQRGKPERRDGHRRDRMARRPDDKRRSSPRGPRPGARDQKGPGKARRRPRGKPRPPKPD